MEDETQQEQSEPREIELRDPLWAAGLALLWPGAGHLYQRRTAKGLVFMVCIMGIFVWGWFLGGGKVVFAQWEPGWKLRDLRWPYLCQVWVGLPAWPALVQTGFDNPLGDGFMAKPDPPSDLAQWQKDYAGNFELGTVFTMVAGLLNVLVIFDAAAGPIVVATDGDDKKSSKDKKKKIPPEEAAENEKILSS